MEGTRPILVEIQALVAPSSLASPRRAVVGWDSGRLAMITAVLDARCGLALGGLDIYLNVAGGLKISEPAADLAVAAALISSLADTPTPPETVVFGEIGLSGEVRPVGQRDSRLKEAAKLGFAQAFAPKAAPSKRDKGKRENATQGATTGGINVTEIGHLNDLLRLFSVTPGQAPKGGAKGDGGKRQKAAAQGANPDGDFAPYE
jgi:DNA repair protein RadA/Sms